MYAAPDKYSSLSFCSLTDAFWTFRVLKFWRVQSVMLRPARRLHKQLGGCVMLLKTGERLPWTWKIEWFPRVQEYVQQAIRE
jgi:hypothetical protein